VKKILALIAATALTLTLAPTVAANAAAPAKKKIPPAVSVFVAQGRDEAITLSWQTFRKYKDQRIIYSLLRVNDGKRLADNSYTTYFNDTNLIPNTVYTYILQAWVVDTQTGKQKFIGRSQTSGLTIPTTVVGLRQISSGSATSLTAVWLTPEYSANPISYNLYLNGNLMAYGIPDTTYTFVDLTPGTFYSVRVVSRNATGESLEAATISGKPA